MTNFEKLGLTPAVLQAVTDTGYITPTPIQAKVIPCVLMGQDLLAIAQTGTGKTASFVLPLIDILNAGSAKARMPRALILVPTRELALQIQENLATYSKHSNISWVTLIGGESIVKQEKNLGKNNDIIIATPGRFLDLQQRGKFLVNNVKAVVIDEADRMLDMGFLPDITSILGTLPPQRQTLLFSATLPDAIKQLTKKYLPFYKEIFITPESSITKNIEQHFFAVPTDQKPHFLKNIIQQTLVTTIVFCNRKRDIEKLKTSLNSFDIPVNVLHGDMTQSARLKSLENFKNKGVSVLIASDVAARGIDIDHLGLVINYDLPVQSEDYVHRIGRTGRAGNLGKAISFVTVKDKETIKDLEKIMKAPIDIKKVEEIFSAPPVSKGELVKKNTSLKVKKNINQSEKQLKPADSLSDTQEKAAMLSSNVPTSSQNSLKPLKKLKTTAYSEPSCKEVIGFGDHMPEFLNKSVKNISDKSSL